MSDYQLTAECAYATVETAYGTAKTLLYKGALLPEGTPELEHLIASGMVEKAGKDATVGYNADGGLGPAQPPVVETPTPDADVKPATGKKPAHADPKADWVEYAVSQGMDRAEAEKASKADLVDALK